MANIQMSYYNGSSYTNLYPKTTVSNLTDLSGSTNILSSSTKTTLGLASTAVPDNAFSTLASMVNSRAKIATGSYVGTGTYGASNPCSLTFDFSPNLILFFPKFVSSVGGESVYYNGFTDYDGHMNSNYFLLTSILTTNYAQTGLPYGGGSDSSSSKSYAKKESNGRKVYWYSTGSAYAQLSSKNTYYYVSF